MTLAATAVPDAASAAARATAGWMVLGIDELRLALPQTDVRLIELIADLKPSATDEAREIGWLLREGGDSWPAYCLDGVLRLQRPAPGARRICVFFEADDGVLGIVCDRVWSLATDAELAVEPVPGCMTGMPSPVAGFARHREGVVLVISAARLTRYLAFLQGRAHDAHE